MLTPDYIFQISERSEEIAAELHDYIIAKITDRMMARLGRGEEFMFTATDKWQIETLQEAGYLLEDIMAEINKCTKKQQKEIKSAMEEAGIKALEYDDDIYIKAGLSPTPLLQSPALVRLMQADYEGTLGEWKNFTRTTANEAQKLFIRELDKAYSLVSRGAASYTQAVAEAVDAVVKDGIRIRYPSGHSDTIETATLRAVRTGISQATAKVELARMEEMDWDIVLVSAHIGARTGDGGQNPGNHFWWQGKFYSRSGKDKRFPDFYKSTGFGTVTGLCGANCRHHFGAGDGSNIPYKDFDNEENQKRYDAEQRQRYLERHIRGLKRELQVLSRCVELSEDENLRAKFQSKYDRKASLLSKYNKEYKNFSEANGLKELRDRLRIAEWNRQQAMKAAGAARRYQSANGK